MHALIFICICKEITKNAAFLEHRCGPFYNRFTMFCDPLILLDLQNPLLQAMSRRITPSEGQSSYSVNGCESKFHY